MAKPQLTKDPKYERWRQTVFSVTWLAYAGFYLTRKSLSVAQIGILAGSLSGVISQKYGWDALFYILGASVLVSGLLLLPKWNAVPKTAGKCS